MKIQTTKDAVLEGNGPRGNVELPRALADQGVSLGSWTRLDMQPWPLVGASGHVAKGRACTILGRNGSSQVGSVASHLPVARGQACQPPTLTLTDTLGG